MPTLDTVFGLPVSLGFIGRYKGYNHYQGKRRL